MNQANQKQVVHQANITLVQIRTAEVSYFSSFFTTFGTQSAVIAGVICGVISQTPGLDGAQCGYPWVFIYFVSSAIVLVTACHALLCCIVISIFGQGLALRGPLGSMIKAIDGMVIEQKHILFTFCITVFFFVLQEAGMFMIVMDEVWGRVCAIIVALYLILTYNYALRIYNRFRYKAKETRWDGVGEKEDPLDEEDPVSSDKTRSSTGLSPRNQSAASGDVIAMQYVDDNPILRRAGKSVPQQNSSEGYLSLLSNASKWERRYFTVRGTHIFYFKDKAAFELEPTSPVNRRPIDLDGYTLVAESAKMLITLCPADAEDIRKAWELRCDTRSEFDTWIENLSSALRLCDSEATRSELVKIVDVTNN